MKKLILALLICGGANSGFAATISAASCNLSDVNAAINQAADNDTVSVPAGSCSWSGSVSTSKGISIIGGGVGVTNIAGGSFTMSAADGKSWRVSGMTITGTGGFNVISHSKTWRIDHIRFNKVAGFTENRIIWIEPAAGGYSNGVIDHAVFDDPQSIQVHVRESWSGGNSSFMRPLDLGGKDAIYIEDSQFNHSVLQISNPVTDCEGGGRIVVRHSSIKNSYTEMHDAIIGGLRSCRKWETYENTFETTYNSGQCGYVGIRGGTGVVFNNTFKNANDCDAILVALYRTYQTEGDPWDTLCSSSSGKACLNTTSTYPKGCNSDADCGGGANSCVALDGPSSSPSGYPCRDQFGEDGNSPQVSRPALFWNNNYGTGGTAPPHINSGGSYIAQNRDYCVGATTMPASCNGVTTTYTPYTYPHPLTATGPRPKPPAIQ